MKNSWTIIWEIISLLIGEAADISRRLARLRQQELQDGVPVEVQDVKMYLKALKKLVFYAILYPIPILIIGIIGGLGWLVALVGIFWALCTLLLLVVAVPLGLLIEVLVDGTEGSGKRYVQLVLGVFLVELTFTLFVSVVPIGQNLAALPIAIVAAVILGVLGAMGTKTILTKRLVGIFAGAVLVISIASFYFPQGVVKGVVGEKKVSVAPPPRAAVASQIYPNYTFEEGLNHIQVPLIPIGQQLTQEAGGWVITPRGSRFLIDYKTPVVIEYIDGRKFYRKPNKPAWDDVRIDNRIFRIYGKENEYAEVEIERDYYR